jgi:TonB family protein
MSDSAAPAQNPLATASNLEALAGGYYLSDDLARLCLPREFKDSNRALAWVDSICLFFLLVGLVGLKPPGVIHRPLSEIADVVPIIFTPPEESPKVEPEVKPEEPQPQDAPADTPQVVTIVAAADPSSVAFAVPVQGTVAIATAAHLATPPPPANYAPPRAVQFNPNVSDGGSYPPPLYPGIAQRNHYEGTVTIEFMVDATGAIAEAKTFKGSGYSVLDEAALEVVKRRWHFPPGQPRLYHWPCIFKFQ